MIHAFAYIIFILPFTAWLGFELKKKYSLGQHWKWIAAAFLTGVVGSIVYELKPDVTGNFFLHASGGVASAFLFVYLSRTLKLKFPWRLTLVILFAWVSTLGVLNELAEYFFELLGFGPFAFDIHDTWRDFVANTTGAFTCWAILKLIFRNKTP
ncbi:MAG: hypothetical protein WD885_03400 [Candidatus Saccharimonadales bacterium]